MRRTAFLLTLCTVSACRLGEPSAISFEQPAPIDSMSSAGAPGGSGGSGGRPAPQVDAGAMNEAAGAGGRADEMDAPDASTPPEQDASARDEPASCSPEVQLCNPVTNEGCPDAMQCTVDFTSDVLAGYCTFSSPPMDGTCFNSGVTESCPPTSTCLDFECRTLCFCDDDCGTGECCVDAVGELGFKACGAC